MGTWARACTPPPVLRSTRPPVRPGVHLKEEKEKLPQRKTPHRFLWALGEPWGALGGAPGAPEASWEQKVIHPLAKIQKVLLKC